MYSEENERLAEAAYNRYRENSDKTAPTWEAYPPKHLWFDLVNTFQATPRSHIAIANPMEQCVSDVILAKDDSINAPSLDAVAEPEATPEPKQKLAKAKDKK